MSLYIDKGSQTYGEAFEELKGKELVEIRYSVVRSLPSGEEPTPTPDQWPITMSRGSIAVACAISSS
jgi:hypothetical protein